MTRVFKTFLLWLLLAALPFQGLAAAVQMSCGPTKRDAPASTVLTAQAHHHEGHDDSASVELAAAKSVGNYASDDAGASHEHSSCSACALCCVGPGAPPSAAALAPSPGKAPPVLVAPLPLVVGFIPAGLERPPKRPSA